MKFYGLFESASDAQQYVKKSDPSTKRVRSYGHEKTRCWPTFASRCSRPHSGWANGTLKLLLAPDWPDRTVSEKLEKSLGCSKLASPEATKFVFLQFFVQIGSTKLSMACGKELLIGIPCVPWIQETNEHKWGRKFF